MARPKVLADEEILSAALALMHERGPAALSFGALASRCGLSASTLVQRFGTKEGLVRATLLHAWDRLDEQTAQAAEAASKTPSGAVDLLVTLSSDYGAVESYADGLLVLREDLRDASLRARGKAWGDDLATALDACFAGVPGAPRDVGRMLASQWQGALLWWSFEGHDRVEEHVRGSLTAFVEALTGSAGADHE